MSLKKITSYLLAVACVTATLTTVAFADNRTVQSYNISVSGLRAENTGVAIKVRDGKAAYGQYRCAFDASSATGKIDIKTTMLNSNGEYKGSGVVSEGSSGSFANNGMSGYGYHLSIKRTAVFGGSAVVKGTWSPDQAK